MTEDTYEEIEGELRSALGNIGANYGFSDVLSDAEDRFNEAMQELKNDREEGNLKDSEHYVSKVRSVVGYDS